MVNGVRVVIGDDHTGYAEGLRALLQAHDIDVVAIANTHDETLVAAKEHEPDVVLLDLRMPGGDASQMIDALAQTVPKARVLIISAWQQPADIHHAIVSGADGFISKELEVSNVGRAIHLTHHGVSVLSGAGREALLGQAGRDTKMLSQEEIDLLRQLSMGRGLEEIALDMALSVSTLKRLLSSAQDKLEVSTRAEALVAAAKQGWI